MDGGTIFEGRYRVERELGRGAMGVVYEAVQLSVGRRVAVKMLAHERTVDEQSRKRFIREAQLISQLEHPNTIRLLDFGCTATGSLYYVMEFLKGESLGRAIHRALFSVADTIHIARQLGKSLAEAHARGIIHRDIKPDNVFLKQVYGEPLFAKLLDFGIARDYEAREETLTDSGFVVGTVRYMSPEQCRGAPLDGRADLYALGGTLAEMLVGSRKAKARQSLAAQLQWVASGPPPPELDIESDDPRGPGLVRLIRMCLEPNREDRPHATEHLLDELEALQHVPTSDSLPAPTILLPAAAPPEPITASAPPALPVPPPLPDQAATILAVAAAEESAHAAETGPDSETAIVRRPPNVIPLGLATPVPRPPNWLWLVLAVGLGAGLAVAGMSFVGSAPATDAPEAKEVGAQSPPSPAERPDAGIRRVTQMRAPSRRRARHSVQPRRGLVDEPTFYNPRVVRAPSERRARAAQSPWSALVLRRRIVSTPEHAEIVIGGRVVGTGRAVASWPAGEEPPTIRVSAPSFVPRTIQLDVGTKDEVNVRLRKKPKRRRVRFELPD